MAKTDGCVTLHVAHAATSMGNIPVRVLYAGVEKQGV